MHRMPNLNPKVIRGRSLVPASNSPRSGSTITGLEPYKPPPQRLFLDMLPSEILLTILENQTYYDLKLLLPLVCRRFRDILQKKDKRSASKIDRTLFRDSPRIPPLEGRVDCRLNPALGPGKMHWRYSSNTEEIIVRSPRSRFGFEKVTDIPLRNENASSPSATTAVYHLTVYFVPETLLTIEGTGEGGAVTVMDVIEGAAYGISGGPWSKHRVEGCPWTGIVRAEVLDGVLHLFAVINSTKSFNY